MDAKICNLDCGSLGLAGYCLEIILSPPLSSTFICTTLSRCCITVLQLIYRPFQMAIHPTATKQTVSEDPPVTQTQGIGVYRRWSR